MIIDRDDSERDEDYGTPQWRLEMLVYMGNLLEPSEQELLKNGPESTAGDWRLEALKREWEELWSDEGI